MAGDAAKGVRYPFDGITVLDLSHIYNGPYASFLMAMAGAEVIKIEPPGGEHLRVRAGIGGAALPFAMLNSNKKCLVLDLKTAEGKALFLGMIKEADVLIENFAPGVTERLGIGPETVQAINPRLIYASSTGYGRSGPYRDYPAMDITVQAMAGVMSITGFPDNPPVKSGPALCDFFAGIHLYAGIATALYEREMTRTGRLVEVSMQEAVYASLSSNLALYHGSGGRSPRRTGNRHGGLAESPYNVYPAADGHVAIICNNNRHFLALLKAMKREDLSGDPRFADLKSRVAHMEAVDALVGAWTSTRTREEIVERLLAVRVPHAPVRDLGDVVNDVHMHARRSLERIDHPEYGPIVVQNSPIRYDALPPMPLVPSGRLGQHSKEVMCERFGLSPEQYDQMRAAGVFGASVPEASAKS